MATLEKIRSKSVLLFTVIIVALLAFILGDFFTSGRSLFGGDTTVGEIGDHEVDVQLYQQRLSELTQGGQYKDDYLYWAQDSLLRAMLYDQMLDEEWEKAGIYVTDKELADYVLKNGDNILRMMYGPNNQIALIPFNVYVDMVKNPSKFGASAENVEQFKNIIAGVEKQAEKVIKGRVYEYMFQGLFTANNLDAKEAFDAKYNNYNISFTSTELSTLKDEDFQVSDDEIKAEWEKNKKAYELEGETRSIKYFTVMITPSADDYTAAENAVNEAIVGLNEKPGVEAIAENFDFIVKTRTYSPRQIQEPQLRSFVDSAKVGEVAVVSRLDKTYRLAKLISAKQEMDDVNISVIATTEATVFDSIITDFKNNTTIGDLINKNKGNVNVGVSDSTWIYLADNNVSKNLKEKLLNAKVGEEVLDTLDNGGTKEYYLYVVNERTPDVKISEVAEIEYTIKPSDKTKLLRI